MMRLHILLIITMIVFDSYSQQNIRGEITSDKNISLEYVNVILYSFPDSLIIKSTLSDELGRYRFKIISPGQYYIKAHLIGYSVKSSLKVKLNEGEAKKIDLSLLQQSTIIKTVEVQANKPFLEQQAGKLVVNVSDNITGLNGSLKDVLKKVPGTMVVKGNVTVAGEQNVRILINGTSTDYMDMRSLLNDFPAEDIDKIEVITQADATMDASGGTVIDIIIKKNKLKGSNGNISASGGKGILYKYGSGFMLNHRNEKINYFGSLRYAHNTRYDEMGTIRKVGTSQFEQTNFEPSLPHSFRLNTGFDFDINDKQDITVSYSRFSGTNEQTDSGITIISDSNYISSLYSINNIERNTNRNSLKVTYNWNIDSSGQNLKFKSRIGEYDRNSSALITSFFQDPSLYQYPIENIEPGLTRVIMGKIDYSVPFNKNFKLKAGVKRSYANIDNNFQSNLIIANEHIMDSSNSNHYIFTETISAIYAQLEMKFGEISINSGLRYEDSRSQGYSKTLEEYNNRDIKKLFPSMSLMIPLSKKLGASMAYSKRIRRPRYSSLNPFKSFLGPYAYTSGNPQLSPQYTDKLRWSLTYKKQPFLNFEYTRTKDVMLFVTEQNDSTGVGFGIHRNLDLYEKIGGSFFFPLNFTKKANGYAGVILGQEKYSSQYLDDDFFSQSFTGMGFLQFGYNISQTFTAEISGWYSGGGFEGIMFSKPLYGLSLGVEALLLNKRLVLDLSIDDLLFKYWQGSIVYSNMDINVLSKWETQILNINIKYKFGNRYIKKRKKDREEEIDRAERKL